MMLVSLYDGPTAAIVFGGTLLATLMRCGPADCRAALGAVAASMRTRFDAERVRAGLAVQVQEIHRDGLLRVRQRHCGDAEFDAATDALIGQRSVAALMAVHDANRTERLALADRATATLAQAAELAPVFGLAGTLISLSRLPTDGIDRGAYMAAIGMAVHATLYGLLAANLMLAPLARLVERSCAREEADRQKVMDWLAGEVALLLPPRHEPAHRQAGRDAPREVA